MVWLSKLSFSLEKLSDMNGIYNPSINPEIQPNLYIKLIFALIFIFQDTFMAIRFITFSLIIQKS